MFESICRLPRSKKKSTLAKACSTSRFPRFLNSYFSFVLTSNCSIKRYVLISVFSSHSFFLLCQRATTCQNISQSVYNAACIGKSFSEGVPELPVYKGMSRKAAGSFRLRLVVLVCSLTKSHKGCSNNFEYNRHALIAGTTTPAEGLLAQARASIILGSTNGKRQQFSSISSSPKFVQNLFRQ